MIPENHPSKTHGVPRSKDWPKTKREFAKTHPKQCAVCGSKIKVQLHHKKPFHNHPDLELSQDNLIWLCERQGHDHHYFVGHLEDFKSWNEDVETDASEWNKKLSTRPY